MSQPTGSFDNPFATRWVAPGALPYLFPANGSVSSILERFYEHERRGSIVGPHGCGKSTLLYALMPYLREEASDVEMVVLRAKQRELPKGVSHLWRNVAQGSERLTNDSNSPSDDLAAPTSDPEAVRNDPEDPSFYGSDLPGRLASNKNLLVVDGWEQLRPWTRMWIDRCCLRASCGLLVTCHKPLRLPVLTRLTPDLAIARKIVGRLTQEWDTDVPADVIEASFRSHQGNCRDLLFDLYDWHERSCQKHRSKR